MKLSIENLREIGCLPGYHVPSYDIKRVRRNTIETPVWLHFGGGNLFRAFQAADVQELIERDFMTTGVITCDSYDDEIVDVYHRTDDLSVQVILNADGSVEKNVIGSIARSLKLDADRELVKEIYSKPSLQMISFTVTEKGYLISDNNGELLDTVKEDMERIPEQAGTFGGILAYLLLYRKKTCGVPVAMVSMDNCAHNGDRLKSAIMAYVDAWRVRKYISEDDYRYVSETVTYPWSMIDRITPRPSPEIADMLKQDGLEEMDVRVTSKGTFLAPFVNTERPKYLVIEDNFPNGRPSLENAGVIFTDRERVDRCELMKVCTCLNPPQTAMAVLGCLLGYTSIAKEFEDEDIHEFIYRMCYDEGMPVVVNPEVISPAAFEAEVFDERLKNEYIRDTPQRIASDTSQKLQFRFGVNITRYMKMDPAKAAALRYMPMVYALWLRYLLGIDDAGESFTCSNDPRLRELQNKLSGIQLGEISPEDEQKARSILKDRTITGTDLQKAGLEGKIISSWKKMMASPGAVRKVLHESLNNV